MFWIVDLDTLIKETREAKKGGQTSLQKLEQYRKDLEGKGNVTVVVNNPCFEYWLLLHFEQTSKYYQSCATLTKQLKKNLRNYEKTETFYKKQGNDIYLQLKPFLTTAIANAKNLGKFDFKNPTAKGMTQMHLIFEILEKTAITR